ncbi:MAG: hypothetical protein BWY93_01624 [Euryarchaeota archaeon ADurb.BinA087]|nr:MAG: hypothetical protein BWY93_01624 [Euryarchaeota archaeon ADurb.BinA087]
MFSSTQLFAFSIPFRSSSSGGPATRTRARSAVEKSQGSVRRPSIALLTREMIFAVLSSPRSTSSVASRFFRVLVIPPMIPERGDFDRSVVTLAIAYPTVLMPPPRSVLMISLESTTISPTPAFPISPALNSTPNLLTISSFSRENALLMLSPSFFHALLSKTNVLSASLMSVVRLLAALNE